MLANENPELLLLLVFVDDDDRCANTLEAEMLDEAADTNGCDEEDGRDEESVASEESGDELAPDTDVEESADIENGNDDVLVDVEDDAVNGNDVVVAVTMLPFFLALVICVPLPPPPPAPFPPPNVSATAVRGPAPPPPAPRPAPVPTAPTANVILAGGDALAGAPSVALKLDVDMPVCYRFFFFAVNYFYFSKLYHTCFCASH
jgi:hypothetical protein